MSFQDLEAGRISATQRTRGAGAPAGQTPSQAVAAGIFQINTSVSNFQRLVNSLGTPKDTPDLREQLCAASVSCVGTKIIDVGRNFATHAKELGNAVPK